MDYKEALEYLHSLHRFGTHLGLSRVQRLLARMGNPHHSCQALHIAGTNGKGSVTAMGASILTEAGYQTGRYVSPYLERFSERICLNQEEISEEELVCQVRGMAELLDQLAACKGENPTEFEVVTALALGYFRDRKAEIVALEVGLGGRYDATNVVDGKVNVITNIGWDHMQQLGDTLEKIAWEKAGIIKPQSTVVTGARGSALGVIEEVARGSNVPVFKTKEHINWEEKECGIEGQVIDIFSPQGQYRDLYLPLLGRHQQENAALAVSAIEALTPYGFTVSEKAIREGLAKTRWPGRLEVLGTRPTLLIDGAHNVNGTRALARALEDIIPYKRLILVLGVLEDKELESLLSPLLPLCSEVIATLPLSPRALEPERVAREVETWGCPVTVERDMTRAVRRALERAQSEDCICVAGSLYLIGHVRSLLRSGI